MPFRVPFLSVMAWGLLSVVSNCSLAEFILFDERDVAIMSRDSNNPEVLGTLQIGQSSIYGDIDHAPLFGNVDVFTITVGPGTLLTEIRIVEHTGFDQISVMGVNNGTTFPFDPSTFTNTLQPEVYEPAMIGFARFGLAGLEPTIGANLLSLTDPTINNGSRIGSRFFGKKPFNGLGPTDKYDSLSEGDYTFYMQEEDGSVQYKMVFTVVAVPEPTSVWLVSSVLGAVVMQRRRRKTTLALPSSTI